MQTTMQTITKTVPNKDDRVRKTMDKLILKYKAEYLKEVAHDNRNLYKG